MFYLKEAVIFIFSGGEADGFCARGHVTFHVAPSLRPVAAELPSLQHGFYFLKMAE